MIAAQVCDSSCVLGGGLSGIKLVVFAVYFYEDVHPLTLWKIDSSTCSIIQVFIQQLSILFFFLSLHICSLAKLAYVSIHTDTVG